jgi:hypothetical protein
MDRHRRSLGAGRTKGLTMNQQPRLRTLALTSACIAATLLGISGCSSSSSGTGTTATTPGQTASTTAKTNSSSSTGAGTGAQSGGTQSGGAGASDAAAICAKLPVADAQALIRATLGPAVNDPSFGGCTFLLPGNQLDDSNLTVAFQVGSQAASRYQQDVSGTFSVGGSTISTGTGVSTPLSGVGDKAVWGSDAGFPKVSALKGDVYCTVSTTSDATQLTIIGGPGDPLPQGTTAQQAQYAQLEGKLCTDLFGIVS